MNYRHVFHAGNFADVVKHATLARIVAYLKQKSAPFRVIDTHAGAGMYDLTGPEASRTGEWRGGIGRLIEAQLAPAVRDLLGPYLDAVTGFNRAGLTTYPGSPTLVQTWLRDDDRLTACEREPGAAQELTSAMRRDRRISVVEIDGYMALNAYVPPKERRGLVLIDPPYEQRDEFDTLTAGLANAHRKWPTGTYMVWYPIKDARTQAFVRNVSRLGIPRILLVEMVLDDRDPERLGGSGLLVVNPPWTLEDELKILLPALASLFGGDQGTGRVAWLTGEK